MGSGYCAAFVEAVGHDDDDDDGGGDADVLR